MGLFSRLFSKKDKDNSISVVANIKEVSIVTQETLNIHQDIKDLIWINDGLMKNYERENKQEIYELNGLRMTMSMLTREEPSLISLKLPVNFLVDIEKVERPPYFPTYQDLTENQKGVYWNLLSNPYNYNIDIGFVFILYYGLERHLINGNYEKAFQVILNMRDVYKNKSFQQYSGNALVLTCLFRQRADLAYEFMKSLDKEFEYQFSDNLFILCKHSLDIPISSKDIMRMAKSFEFTKLNYIKNYPDIFEEVLRRNIITKYSKKEILISNFITASEMKKIRLEEVTIFANVSIIDKTIKVPLLVESFKFKMEIYNLLESAHEQVKVKLKELRKSGGLESEKTIVKKSNVILTFNEKEEITLLKALKRTKNNFLDRHFILIGIQDFYYKYRDVNFEYIEKCIEYCNMDIESLEAMQRSYYDNRLKEINELATIYNNEKVENEISNIERFKGNIPAFKRLAIIYEKRKDYEKGVGVCDVAIDYYNSVNMMEQTDEFTKRKNKLSSKI